MTTPRYLPDEALPGYAFVPGRDPHPSRDPRGHSYGRERAWPYREAADWRRDEGYLYGVDLYNLGYLWESHEAWEGLWMVARERDPDQAELLQGLIQLSAAALKVPMGQALGLARLTETGAGRLEALAARHERLMGLPLAAHAAAFRAFAAGAPGDISGRPRIRLEGLRLSSDGAQA